ncbi:DUF4192 domain-containing protein [Saccharomonospora piscinae]|uniref:DUF4192 domain-containing protein n=1 Tax=Saccharomonospora piscinae TaxID=687388 RepID=UPI001105A70D|nr:DUF4192 domain-containing protein [Saccharomonospora piscinae]TLW92227.1 DUF4192 domain-containing protein [Saccharomonospora piscinae]
MTSSSTTDFTSTDDDTGSTVDLRDPGELLAALPHLLGFEPVESLILIGHRGEGGKRIGNVVRADLPEPGGEVALAQRLLDPVAQDSVAVTAAVVGRRRPGASVPPSGSAVAAVGEVFARCGLPLVHALWAPEIRAGAPWRCYEDACCSGHLPDPQGTVMAAITTHAGLVTHASRAAMARQLDPVDPEVLTRRTALLRRRAAHGRQDDEAAFRRGRAAIRTALARTRDGTFTVSDTEVVELAAALAVPSVRDACLATALPAGGALALVAERLWLRLTRHTPAPERAQPATLLAYSAYVRGEGAFAGMALEVARESDPEHLLAQLLSQALDHGLPPETIAGLARTCDVEPIWEHGEAGTPEQSAN